MEQIVQQMTIDFVKVFMRHFTERGLYELGGMAKDSEAMAKEFAKGLLTTLIEETDRALAYAKHERRTDGIAIQERDVPRTLYTALGELTYKRAYYSTTGGRSYLLDELLGVTPYERVDTHICARLVNSSGIMSFGRSADVVASGKLSRQTVWRKAMETGEVAVLPDRLKTTPERIHIFADEDHVHRQDGKRDILPLITICSGKEYVSKDRYELTDRIHVNGYGLETKKRWEYVYAICDSMFDMRKVKEIYIYGDDAPWIAASDECFPTAIRVLDAQHFRQYMKGILAGEICSGFALRLYGTVKYGKKDAFANLVEEIMNAVMNGMPECRERARRLKTIRKNGAYILSNWDAVQNMYREGSIGSCTEAMVSHVFSERFSRNPMGWSEPGLSKMSMLRVFIKNGGRIMPIDIGLDKRKGYEERTVITCIKKYETLVTAQWSKIFDSFNDWGWFERERVSDVAPSGTKVLLDAVGRTRSDI
jgi:hypothetical protein